MDLTTIPSTGGLTAPMWRIMKLTIILLTAAALHVSARGLAQNITISEKNVPLQNVFKEIERQSGYQFFYNDKLLKNAKRVTIQVKDVSLQQALDQCFRDQPLTWSLVNQIIVVKQKQADPNTVMIEQPSPPIDVHGKIINEDGQAVPGVSVQVKGDKTKGTTTNANGEFMLRGVDENATLVFSGANIETFEKKLNGKTELGTLEARNKIVTAEEVIVIKGYYSVKERENTGNVTTITSKIIEKEPINNVLQALEGQVPGLLITQQNGLPGGAFTVQLRGLNSLSQGNNPYYIIDGVPFDANVPDGLLNSNLRSASNNNSNYLLNFLNPYDIESIQILKDADATAIYGSRGANGVILINTKQGKIGPMHVDVKLNTGFSNPARDLPMMNLQQYMAMRREAFKNDGVLPGAGDHDVNGDWDTTRYTDWQKVLTHAPAPYLNADVSVSGGNSSIQYIAGMSYYRQGTSFPTLLPNDGADQRPSFHFNLNSVSTNQKFKMTISGSYSSDKNTVQSGITRAKAVFAPDAPAIFNPDGSLNWAPLIPGQRGTWSNPYAGLYMGYKNLSSNLVGNTVLSYQILKDLEFKTSIGYTNTQTDEVQTIPKLISDPASNSTSRSSFKKMGTHSFIVEPQINYHSQLGKGVLNALIGGTYIENANFSQTLNVSNFSTDALLSNPQAGGSIDGVSASSSQYKYEAIYARVGYNLLGKYLLNLTARRDGSSRFGPDKQFGNFGSAGAGWIFSDEKFTRSHLSFLSFGKLRASYGITGSDQVANYNYLDLYNITAYPYNGVVGFVPSSLFNPDLAWEVNRKFETGIELGFLKDRIGLSISFYKNRSSNQLASISLPLITGFLSLNENLPFLIQNSGWEYQIKTTNIQNNNFRWTSSFNLSMNRNKVLQFTSNYASILVIGQPLNIVKAYHMAGVNPQTGLYQFQTANNQLTYNPNANTDRIININPNPVFFGGITNNISFKGFDLSFFFQFVKQTGLNLFGSYNAAPGVLTNQPSAYLDHWRNPGDQAKYQKYSQQGFNNTYSLAQSSDFAYGDASYIRLKNLSLSWTLPHAFGKKIGMQNCQIFGQAQNLLTITKYNGIDPESQGAVMPPMRVYTLGLQARF